MIFLNFLRGFIVLLTLAQKYNYRRTGFRKIDYLKATISGLMAIPTSKSIPPSSPMTAF
jgi:hypothetical protein